MENFTFSGIRLLRNHLYFITLFLLVLSPSVFANTGDERYDLTIKCDGLYR